MQYRRLGKTDYQVSAVGFGAWQIGGDWGRVDEGTALATLNTAVDSGVTFFDTADVYGDGRSERLIGKLRAQRSEPLIIATKMGRRAPLDLASYTRENFSGWIDRSRRNLGVDRLDLIQLHCPPPEVYEHVGVFDLLEEKVAQGTIAAYGVSVERVEEALKAIEYPGVATVQIIFNIFRQRPADQFLLEAKRQDVGVIARVPLASGLLTGKLRPDTTFSSDDHRNYNRHGESFDVGETFAGVDYQTGLKAVEELRPLVPAGETMAQFALRWILMNDAVSTVIPGAKNPEQAHANAQAADLPPLPEGTMERVAAIYRERVAPLVHQRW